MATDRARSATPTNQTPRASKNNLTRTVKYNYRIQSAPPLSLQQFLRSSTGILAGAKEWRPSGKVNQPKFNLYLSPAVYEKKKPVEPKWNPPGRYREKPLTSLSPEKVVPKHVPEPVWHPPGRYREKPPTSLSPETIVPKRVPEPVWHPPGPFKEKPPTSLSPEKVIPTHVFPNQYGIRLVLIEKDHQHHLVQNESYQHVFPNQYGVHLENLYLKMCLILIHLV